MASSKKAIIINPEYFSLKKKKSGKVNKSISNTQPVKTNGKRHKKELLKRLKEIQNNQSNSTQDEPPKPAMNDSLHSSLEFLSNLSKTTPQPIALQMTQSSTTNEPPYSNLKYGAKKPSYKEWKKTSTPPIVIEKPDPPEKPTIRETTLHKLRAEVNPKPIRKYKQKTIKITETFGKRNGKVGIHIKNNTDKELIETERKTLKKHNLPKIKSYLKTHNLLKTGTYAPQDVLREIYENAYLSGNVHNQNKDILVHNFLEN